MRWRAWITAAAVTASVVTASVKTASPVLALEKIRTAIVSRTVFFMPLWIADQKGFLREEGIDPTIAILDNAEKINAEIASGAAQIAITSPELVMISAYMDGHLHMLASMAQKPPHYIVAKPSIKSLGDLRGARFGALSMFEGTTFLIDDLARAAGLKTGDYSIAAVGGAPTRWKLLQEGKIDAALQPFPLSYESDAAGFSNLGPIADYVPDYEFTVVLAADPWAKANRALVTSYLRALRRGQDFMTSNPDETTAIAARELRTSPALATRALADSARIGIIPDGLSVSDKGLTRVLDTLKRAGFVAAWEPYRRYKFVDDSYLDPSR
jgi:NitT/TauT family transport system substrate-binding protein